MIFQANGIQKQTEVVIFKHNKTYLPLKLKETKIKTNKNNRLRIDKKNKYIKRM